jgi:hypothetical protein
MTHLPNSLATRLASLTERRSIVRHALDRAGSVRSYDQDGRLRVSTAVITKACVSPYLGSEIPDYEQIGLNPSATYMMLRPADELRKALATFNNIPILSRHVPVSAEDHQPGLVIGATGSDAKITGDELTNSLVIWALEGIDMIESGRARSLSCGYRYTAVMQPTSFMGVRADGFMKNILANHLAVVDEPRVMGAMVGDSKPTFAKDTDMDPEKLMNFLASKLSQEDLITVGKMLAGNDDDGMASDDPPPFKGRPETGGTMTGDRRRKAAADFDARYPGRSKLRAR